MRILADQTSTPSRIVLPVMEKLPDNPIIGELVYFNQKPYESMMIYNGQGWIPLYATRNNIWEKHIAEKDQVAFTLAHQFDIDGKSIVVYKDGIRLSPDEFVEASDSVIVYKGKDEEGEDIEILGGEVFEFQIFNVRQTKTFDVKSFNRRRGIC